MSMQEISWDDASVQPKNTDANRKIERFVGKQGITTRIAILTEKPVRTFTHYKKGYGYFSCLKVDGLECVACAAGDRVSEKYATNILVYPPNAAPGVPLDLQQLKLMLWQPGPKVFNDLRAIRQEWGDLRGYDIKVTCTNEQYQHLNITNCRESLWATDGNAAQIAQYLEANIYDLKKIVGGKKETVDEVRRIWTTNITRDQIKSERDKMGGAATEKEYAPTASAPGTPTPALPDFAALLGGRK